MDDQIVPFDQLDPHATREQRVFEIRRIVDTGREEHDGRFVTAAAPKALRRAVAQRSAEPERIVVDG